MNEKKSDRNRGEKIGGKFIKLEESIEEQKEVWTFDERCRLVEALDSKFSGFNNLVTKHVGTKPYRDVKNYSKFYQLLETGVKYPDFLDSTPVDAWIALAEKTGRPDDKQAGECIPQIMTVAALEPNPVASASDPSSSPNYTNIYNYLALLLRGGKPPDLSPVDAEVVLSLMDDLIERFANSYTMLQREFLHDAFGALNGRLDEQAAQENNGDNQDVAEQVKTLGDISEKTQNEQRKRKYSSLNPLNVPAILLDFKKKKPITLDFSTKWRTKIE